MKKPNLKKYQSKRNFNQSPKPQINNKLTDKNTKPIFVIQKHDAKNLHYDLRLQIGDVLKSWAIPKGPPTNPKVKRLAIKTEDHPLNYAEFKGKIPQGEYGAGNVTIWDKGEYKNQKNVSMTKCFKKGKIVIKLKGKQLKGNYALIRFRKKTQKNLWLLIKKTIS